MTGSIPIKLYLWTLKCSFCIIFMFHELWFFFGFFFFNHSKMYMACRSYKNRLWYSAHGPFFAKLCSKACSQLTRFIHKLKVLESWRWKLTPLSRQWNIQEFYNPAAPRANGSQTKEALVSKGVVMNAGGESNPYPSTLIAAPAVVTISWADRWRLSWSQNPFINQFCPDFY